MTRHKWALEAQVTWRSGPNAYDPYSCYPIFSHGDSLWPVDGRKEDSGLLYRSFCIICRHHPNVDSFSTIAPYLGHPWRAVVKENPPSEQNFGQYTWLLREMTRHWITTPTHGLWPVVWLNDQGHGKLLTRKLGEEVSIYIYRPLGMGINHEDSCYLCPPWMLTTGWHQQKRILIIKWIGWLYNSVSFCSHPCHHPMGSWTKWPSW